MTVKEVFELRKQGKIEEAYETIRPMYAVHQGKYTTLCMFWTASDILKKRVKEQRLDEAEKILEEYKKLDIGQSDFGHIYLANYLLQHNRYAEAADNLAVLDRFIHDSKMELTLDNLILYTNKIGANVGAGRKDTALYVAEQVAENYPMVLAKQRENDAIKMATIYDTQGKEREIAEQKAKIQHQRIVGLIVAIVLLTIFFVIYTMVRRRAAKRLAEMKAALDKLEKDLERYLKDQK